MKDKIIEILKEETHDSNAYTGDDKKQYKYRKQQREIKLTKIATRIDSLYSGDVNENDIDRAYMKWYFGSDDYVIPNPNEPINNTFYAQLNTWRDCVKWFKSHPTSEISKEYPFKCNKCGFEFTSDDLGHTYLTCTQPFSQRTSGICGGAIELNYPVPEISEKREVKTVNFESPSALLEHEKWMRSCREKQKCDEVVYVEIKNPKDKDFDTLHFAELYDKPDGIKVIKKRIWLKPIPFKEFKL